jgi:hypothetical protein
MLAENGASAVIKQSRPAESVLREVRYVLGIEILVVLYSKTRAKQSMHAIVDEEHRDRLHYQYS